MRTGARAFTLVELLVVVAVIALLIGVLVPALAGARGSARQMGGLSNIRQLSAGWHMYADHNNGVCLPGRMYDKGGGANNPANQYDVGNGKKTRARWLSVMGKFVGEYAFSAPDPKNDRQNYDNGMYVCPAAADRANERNACYGYNYQFLGNSRGTAAKFHNFPVMRDGLRTFTGTVICADSIGTAAGFAEAARVPYDGLGSVKNSMSHHGWSLDPPRLTARSDCGEGGVESSSNPRTAVDARHRGKANAAFADGHAAAMTPQELGYRTDKDGRFVNTSENGETADNTLFSGKGSDEDPKSIS